MFNGLHVQYPLSCPIFLKLDFTYLLTYLLHGTESFLRS